MLNKTTKWEDKSPFISDLAVPIAEENRESSAVQGTVAEPAGPPGSPHPDCGCRHCHQQLGGGTGISS